MANYDEDLAENPFFQLLQNEHYEVFHRATSEGWIICVPRAGSVPKYALTHEDIFGHILIPSDELPESHFRTLNDKEVRISNRGVTVEQEDISRPHVTHILFEETFYKDELKYKVVCIDSPLEKHLNFGSGQNDLTDLSCISSLRDGIDLLWSECGGQNILGQVDQCIKRFCAQFESLESEPLGILKELVSDLYIQCLQITLQDARLRERVSADKHLLENVKLSVETYMHHGVYKGLIKGISACTAIEDSNLNKIIRNLSDIQLRDLDIRTDLYGAVPWAKQELARIECYSTVLGKIGCLKRMVACLSQQNVGVAKQINICDAISADDLLPIIVFLIIKTNLPNWIAHLTYMKEFHFSVPWNSGVDEHSFLITTLEAAIEHVKSGHLLGPLEPESQIVQWDSRNNSSPSVPITQAGSSELFNLKTCGIGYFFDQVRLGNIDYVKDILERKKLKSEIHNSSLPQLCHPLCSCDKCEILFSKNLCDTTPSINSRDDRGFTALHVACLVGQPAMVDLLVNLGSNIDSTDYSSSTPLHYAAAKGHQNAVLLLIHSGCNLEVYDSDGNTPLHLASNNGHEGCVKALLYFAEHMSMLLNVNCTNSSGDTPLHHASRWGYEGIVQILLDYGALPYSENKRHISPLDIAHSLHVSRLLIKENNRIHTSASFKSVALDSNKIKNGKVDKGKISLDFSEERSKNFASSKNRYVRSVFCPQSTDQMKQVEKVIRCIADGDIMLACYYMGLEAPCPQPKDSSNEGKSYCHPLCTCDKCRPSDILDENPNANEYEKKSMYINVCNSEGFTALHVAAMHGRTDMVRLLMDSGSYTNVQTRSKGVTPLHLACQNQRLSVLELLLQSSECNVNVQDFRGNTPLHYACYTGNQKLVRLILRASPELNVRNNNGKTAKEEAEENLCISLVNLLKNAEKNNI